MKASPAPSTLNTSTGKPGPETPWSMVAGIEPGKAVQPMGPRLTTISASGAAARTARIAAMVSVLPPAMWISSSVPTTRSHSGRMVRR